MNVSEQIKVKGLPNAKHVYNRASISRDLFYKWSHKRPEVFDLLVKGCLYEKLIKKFPGMDI